MSNELLNYISDPKALIKRASELFGNELKLASSFSMEDICLMHMAKDTSCRVFALDTGRLPEETFQVAEDVCKLLKIKVEWYFPESSQVEKLENNKGLFSFKESVENRKECCNIRKVEPLSRALSGAKCWITGQRREQSITRTNLQEVEASTPLKLNPLAAWTSRDVKDYINNHSLPYNTLYDLGYLSIGCAPCTRVVKSGESERAGRWWWEEEHQKECGIHMVDGKLVRAK